jgi:glycyl-tRNA synthetase beta chain
MRRMKGKKEKAADEAGATKTAEFLFEIGTEELPYQFVVPALRTLAETTERLLKEHRLDGSRQRVLGTPRRLVVIVEQLPDRQAPATREVMGPPKSVAFDAAGQPTKAAVGFATSQGLSVEQLETRQTPKGNYLFAVKKESGKPTAIVLADLLPALVTSLQFPKSMRWNDTGIRFARPIRWLLALYAGKLVKATIGGVPTGTSTYGHRFLSSSGRKGLPVRDAKSYEATLERHGVIPDQDRRRKLVLEQLMVLARSAGGHLHGDEELLEQAVYTVEYPQAIVGSFHPDYLALPREILTTSMKEHQGYFSLLRPDGTLLPQFIAVTNMKLPNMRLIREGNERVLAARLADAKFYFGEDRKVPLADRVDKLQGVTFHKKLGTLRHKTERVVQLAERVAGMMGLSDDQMQLCRRAAELSKADLLTGVVGEFPTLQGIMGGEYARHDGEAEELSQAIAEHYLPKGMEGDLPRSTAGKVLSLADRLDTITAFFFVGLIPTGSEDPFGLRRHATSIVRLVIEGNIRLNFGKAINDAKTFVEKQGFGTAPGLDVHKLIVEFIFERLKYYGRTLHGLREDVMDAVLRPAASGPVDLMDLFAKMKALQAITTRPGFDPLIVGYKRAHRLVDKEKWTREEINEAAFQHSTEGDLYRSLEAATRQVRQAIDQQDYGKALEVLVALKPAIDAFFLGVMVNAEDPTLRANRLSLLFAVDRLFLSFADFSQIVVPGG